MIGFTKAQWLVGGSIAILLLCSTLLVGNGPSPLRPIPVHQVILALLLGGGFVLVLPVIYLVTLAALWNAKWLAHATIGVSLVLAVLSPIWFMSSWEGGYTYQGAAHTRVVAFENAVGIVLVVALSILGWHRRSRQLQVSAYFGTFALLSWCAFPYLGEML